MGDRTEEVRAKTQNATSRPQKLNGRSVLAVARENSGSVRSRPVGGARLYRKCLACAHRGTGSRIQAK